MTLQADFWRLGTHIENIFERILYICDAARGLIPAYEAAETEGLIGPQGEMLPAPAANPPAVIALPATSTIIDWTIWKPWVIAHASCMTASGMALHITTETGVPVDYRTITGLLMGLRNKGKKK